jgi:hypothetical protein
MALPAAKDDSERGETEQDSHDDDEDLHSGLLSGVLLELVPCRSALNERLTLDDNAALAVVVGDDLTAATPCAERLAWDAE